jgi:pimeloyl-ACP methyl ester carboxylesterase
VSVDSAGASSAPCHLLVSTRLAGVDRLIELCERSGVFSERCPAQPLTAITTLCLASGPDTVVEDQRRPCEPGKGIMTCDRFHVVGNVGVVLAFVLCSPAFAQVTDSQKLLAEADRLAWLRVWTRAEPIYAQAREGFVRSGDRRNALYAEVSQLRGQLPTLPVPEVSERLSAYLDNPVVENDERLRLRLRVLIIKGETDEDLDPSLSQRWTEALAVAQKLGEAGWTNRARGPRRTAHGRRVVRVFPVGDSM